MIDHLYIRNRNLEKITKPTLNQIKRRKTRFRTVSDQRERFVVFVKQNSKQNFNRIEEKIAATGSGAILLFSFGEKCFSISSSISSSDFSKPYSITELDGKTPNLFCANLIDQRIREGDQLARGFSAPCIKHTHAHVYTRAHGEARCDCNSLSRAPPLRDNI